MDSRGERQSVLCGPETSCSSRRQILFHSPPSEFPQDEETTEILEKLSQNIHEETHVSSSRSALWPIPRCTFSRTLGKEGLTASASGGSHVL